MSTVSGLMSLDMSLRTSSYVNLINSIENSKDKYTAQIMITDLLQEINFKKKELEQK